MISRFNYTDRKTIRHKMVNIVVEEGPPRSFDAKFNFEGVEFPPKARVYVEAMSGGSPVVMRFDFGAIAGPTTPHDTKLTELPGDTVHFTVKVVDESEDVGRLLGLCENIRPKRPGEEGESGRISILPVNPTAELGEMVWRLNFANGRPWLDVNNKLTGILQIARDDQQFFSLVYPDVIRQILCRATIREGYLEVQNNDDDWRDQWVRFAIHWHPDHELPPSVENPNEMTDDEIELLEAWVDDVVRRFSEINFVRLEYQTAVDGVQDR